MEEKTYFVGVKFQGTSKSYYFSTDMDDLKIGDYVVVETIAGFEMGQISTRLMDAAEYKSSLALKPILRKPTKSDMDDFTFNLAESKKALKIAEREIQNLGLPMNLLEANYTLDGTKVTITYTADNRVDFRELLRILAPQLHCRIELRQIAPRDKAKLVGGIGTCGLPLCCSTFLDQFDGISISRAKNQMLTLNIPKLSGACGKLICCLLYEDDMYTEAKKEFPHLGTVIHLDDGDYTISGMNILSKQIKLVSGASVRFLSLEETIDAIKGIRRPKKNLEEMPQVSVKSDLVAEEKGHSNDEHRDNRNNKNRQGKNRNQNNQNQNNQNRNNQNNRNRQQNQNGRQNNPQNNPQNNNRQNHNRNRNRHHNHGRPNQENKKPQ
ncbi:MAG: stage 0 sporulation protein [Bacilli bacterium]|nr:stage 0 sporulation protein [Bacilli bacterium]